MRHAQVSAVPATSTRTRIAAAAVATMMATAIVAAPAPAAADDSPEPEVEAASVTTSEATSNGLDYIHVFDNEPVEGVTPLTVQSGDPDFTIGLDGVTVALADDDDQLTGYFPAPDDVVGLDDIGTLTYDVLRSEGSTALDDVAPAFIVAVTGADRLDAAASGFTTFVFEPVYNGTVTEGEWSTWDAFADGDATVWSTQPVAGAETPDDFVSWDDVIAANPDAEVAYYGFSAGSTAEGLAATVNNFRMNDQVVNYTVPGGFVATSACEDDTSYDVSIDLTNDGDIDIVVGVATGEMGDGVAVPAGEVVTYTLDGLLLDQTVDIIWAFNDVRNATVVAPDGCDELVTPEPPAEEPPVDEPDEVVAIGLACDAADGKVVAGDEVACLISALDAGAEVGASVVNDEFVIHAEGLVADAEGNAGFTFVVPTATKAGDVLTVTAAAADDEVLAQLDLTVVAEAAPSAADRGEELPRTGGEPAALTLFALMLGALGTGALRFAKARS